MTSPPSLTEIASRISLRITILCVAVAFAVLARADTAVAQADLGGLSLLRGPLPDSGTDVATIGNTCSTPSWCARLPTEFAVLYVVLTLVACVVLCVLFGYLASAVASATVESEDIQASLLARRLSVIAWSMPFLSGALVVSRCTYVLGYSVGSVVAIAKYALYAVMAISIFLVFRDVVLSHRSSHDQRSFAREFFSVIGNCRLIVVLVSLYAVALTEVPLTQEQLLDALRVFVGAQPLSQAFGQLMFLVTSTVLLSLTIFEGVARLELESGRIESSQTANAEKHSWLLREPGHVRRRIWVAAGILVSVVGVWLRLKDVTGGGPIVLGGILIVLGLMDLSGDDIKATRSWSGLLTNRWRKSRDPVQNDARPTEHENPARESPPDFATPVQTTIRMRAQRISRTEASAAQLGALFGAVPLVVVAIDLTLSLFDMVVFEGAAVGDMLWPLLALMLLLGAAIYMTTPSNRWSSLAESSLDKWINTVVVVGGTAGLLALLSPGVRPVTLLAVLSAGLVLVVAVLTFGIGRDSAGARPLGSPWTMPLTSASVIGVAVAVHLRPVATGQSLGTVALLNIFVSGCVIVGYWITRGVAKLRAPRALGAFRVDRMPLLSLLAIWWVLSGLVLVPPGLHDVRQLDDFPVESAAPTIEEAFKDWVADQPEFTQSGLAEADQAPHAVPMVLIASHGGGIRAAYWTSLVMDCIVSQSAPATITGFSDYQRTRDDTCTGTPRPDSAIAQVARRVFMTSGVSGGGVGLAAYAAELSGDGTLSPGWENDRLGRDVLAPVAGWGLFHDLPNHLLGLSPDPGGSCRFSILDSCLTQDRAAVLEQALDDEFGGDEKGIRELWSERAADDGTGAASTVPLLVFNSSMPASPFRAVISAANLSAWPFRYTAGQANEKQPVPVSGAADVSDMLCGTHDIRLSTAAVLAARFPLVSPSGRFPGNCRGEGSSGNVDPDAVCAGAVSTCQSQLVDGGYIDNSGTLTLSQVWTELRRLILLQNARTPQFPIAPVFVEIDSHYQGLEDLQGEAANYGETLVPALVARAAPSAIEVASGLELSGRLSPYCGARIAPPENSGVRAPLGWSLSQASRDNLGDALTRTVPGVDGESGPAYALRRLQQWLSTGIDDQSDGIADSNSQSYSFRPALRTCVPRLK